MTDLLQDDRRDAIISDDGEYRYRLSRTWNVDRPTAVFVMLNPSTADATNDDPTIRRCIGFANTWGYGSLVVGNLFALRTKEPEDLYDHPEPVGPANDEHLRAIVEDDPLVVASWGNHGGLHDRGACGRRAARRGAIRAREDRGRPPGAPAVPAGRRGPGAVRIRWWWR